MIDISYLASCEDFKVEFSFGTVQEAAGITEESIGERFAVYHILFFAQCDVELASLFGAMFLNQYFEYSASVMLDAVCCGCCLQLSSKSTGEASISAQPRRVCERSESRC